MKKKNSISQKVYSLIALLILFASCSVEPQNIESKTISAENEKHSVKLWYQQPANAWTEALPIGNGRLGAMVFGKVQNERIQINEETLWTGGPHDYNNYSAINNLSTVRDLIFNDSLQKATDIIENKMLGNPKFLQAYQPFCDLNLQFKNHTNPTNYKRELDLNTALVTVTYSENGVNYKREYFSSAPEQLIVIRFSADKKNAISFTSELNGAHSGDKISVANDNELILTGEIGSREERRLYGEWKGKGVNYYGKTISE